VHSFARNINVIGITSISLALTACAANGVSPTVAGTSLTAPSTFTDAVARATQPATRAHHPAWMKFATEGPQGVIYVSSVDSDVLAFARKNPNGDGPLCSIPVAGQVFGLGVDPSGNLWAADNNGNAFSVQEFGRRCGMPGATLSDPGFPSDVTFDSKGTAYVSNFEESSGPGSIEVYKKGAKSPTGSLSDPSILEALNAATDRSGDLFATIVEPSNAYAVIEFPGGAMPGSVLGITGFKEGWSMIIDSENNLIVDDIGNPSQLDVYPPPYTGAPARTISLMDQSESCVLAQHQKRIYCGDDIHDTIDVYAYPSGKYRYSYGGGITSTITGVATFPL